jgi:hypothetical protein
MRNIKTRFITNIICCLLCVALLTGGAGGGVLCIGKDGHAHLDTAFHAVCEEEVPSDCHFYTMGESEDEDCLEHEHEKQCIDIPLALGITKPTVPVKQNIPITHGGIPATESSRILNSGSITLDLIPPNNPSLRDLNTVIFLT